jgi:hypothetical protein
MENNFLYKQLEYEEEYNSFRTSISNGELKKKLSILNRLQVRNSENNFVGKYNELELEQSFNERIFNELFDYNSMYCNAEGGYEAVSKFNIGREANDFSLGYFTIDNIFVHKVSVELKRPNIKDMIKRKISKIPEKETPYKQAFNFAKKREEFEWIILCNFNNLLLYDIQNKDYHLEFNLMKIQDEEQMARLLFPLQLGAFFIKNGNTGRLGKIKRRF